MNTTIADPAVERLSGTDASVAWILDLIASEAIRPCRALVPCAEMAAEAVTLGKNGFETIVVDPSAEALKRVAELARYQEADVNTFQRESFTAISSFVGPVALIFDRILLHRLPPERGPEWAHVAGRVLPMDGTLLGLFRIGAPTEMPPHSVSLERLEFLLQRHFTTHLLQEAGAVPPGSVQVWKGIFRRK